MPMYIKLDINKNGNIDAYIDGRPSWDGLSPKHTATTASQVLRSIAASIAKTKDAA